MAAEPVRSADTRALGGPNLSEGAPSGGATDEVQRSIPAASHEDLLDDRVAVAMVAFGESDETIEKLLDQLDALKGQVATIYLVANNPERPLTSFAKRATVLHPERNIGYAGGANAAVRKALADGHRRILLLNLDVHLLGNDLIAKLTAPFQHYSDCGFVSPTIVYWPEKETLWYRGGKLYLPAWLTRHPGMDKPVCNTGTAARTDFFSGCCALVDIPTFEELGGYCEDLFMYYEEADLSFRAKSLGKFAYHVDLALIAHAKDGRRLDALEAYQHARNSRFLLLNHESGLARYVGRTIQFAVAPLQLRRCRGAFAAVSYLRGLIGLPNTALDRMIALRTKAPLVRGDHRDTAKAPDRRGGDSRN